ncbi:MAG: YraN family protein [Kordiimonadaceae bacterium]|jgi:putative endonuclease|nr:YraN family protein [Kordiimonadaceae bacterium]MBT6035501.1 YraN family protein [Kordiimonadaceae bacterium]MBT6328520.1 YraN family protein [Kordiimonadaceae bacterium]MBT7582432.1 YraN family protein [Kordiimonadaceae bacterium]
MTKSKKIKAYRLGHYAEYLAVIVLSIKGYAIKERRYRSPLGEIDIIAKKGRTTIFCEVKARKDYVTAVESLSEKQRQRISRSAEYYMSHLKMNNANNKIENEIYRCDMILVMPWRWPVHIKNAW